MRKDSANNKSNYSEKEPPNLDSRSRRFTLERVFGEGCQGHFSPSTGRRERFRDFQPLFVMRATGSGFLPSSPAAGLAWFHFSCIFNLVATTSIGLRSWQAEWLPGGQHIDLSEARGLVLFWVVREGIGITRRLSAQCALGAYRR